MSDNVIDQARSLYRNISDQCTELSNKVQMYNNQQNDLLHYIELENYNAATGSKLIKEMKQLRKERRIVKNKQIELLSILNAMEKSRVIKNKTANQKYKYRTNIVKQTLGK